MSTENKPAAEKKPMPAASASRNDPFASYNGPVIPVKNLVRLHKATQIPGRQQDDAIRSEKSSNGFEWLIEYMPGIRAFRVTFTNPLKKETRVVMVHETHVLTWEPA